MATKVIHVSDLSGQVADEQELGKLTVVEHPGFTQTPVTLEVLPDELKDLQAATQLVVLEYQAPGARRPERITMTLDDFEKLHPAGEMNAVLLQAAINGRERRAQATATAAKPARRTRARVNYAIIEHAGEPHRGRITDAEKRLVQENLDQINERLTHDGYRTIDPSDPKVAERYGLNAAS